LKIGVFDSGLGGLTVVRSLLRILSDSSLVYLADTLHAPYGEKSHEQIRDFSLEIAHYFVEQHRIDALVVACNTATSAAIATLRAHFPDLILVGTEPGIKPALSTTRSRKVGILATPATLAGDKYQELADHLYNGTDVILYEQACPGLVEQIERGELASDQTRTMLEGWLSPMREAGVDTIVLGCTHYPVAADQIREVMASELALIETGDAIAHRLAGLLGMTEREGGNTLEVLATGALDQAAAERIVGQPLMIRPITL
jgi:glutamate racemase